MTDERLLHDLIASAQRDPTRHMVMTMYAHAWADGYDQALQDARKAIAEEGWEHALECIDEMRLERSHRDLRAYALERAAEKANEQEVAMIVALAELAKVTPLA